MNASSQSYEGYAAHPDLGEGTVAGRVFIAQWKLCFAADTGRLEIPLDRVAVEFTEKGDGPVGFSHFEQPDLKFFTFDGAILQDAALLRAPGIRAQVQARLQHDDLKRRWRLVLYAFAVCVLIAWLGSLAAGAAMRAVVSRIPLSWDAKEGNAVIKKLEKKLPFVTNSNAVAQLTALARPLTQEIPTNRVQFQFHILADPDANAFALPGGHIVVTTGLLKLADRPEELLGVLAHEMAHVTQRHALRHEISGLGPIYMVRILTGGRNQALEALAFPSELLAYESFSQQYEREADAVGWDYLVAAHVNPHGMIDLFRKLEAQEVPAGNEREHPAFDSHPALQKRIAWLEAKWEKLPDKNDFIPVTNAVPEISARDLPNPMEKLLR